MKNHKLLGVCLNLVFGLILTYSVSAQCIDAPDDPCISVRQSTLDKAKQIVDRLKAAEAVIAAFEKERIMTDNERKAWLGFKDAAEQTVAILNKGIADRDKVIELSMKVIDKMNALNDKLLAQLDKKPSLWSKFVNILKSAVLLITGAAIRGSL